ncbi:MAG TPA: SAM-dependent chlorinase/fluorinase [Nitrospirota bacterium]|jgi:hypothetical protein
MDLRKNLVTLTTDFGTRDYFVGAMKGVMYGINPDVNIVDISHEVPSHDIWGAAYLLSNTYRYFPEYTINVVVVDPGVGSQRRPILAVTDKRYFIAPDNGVLSFIFNDPEFSRVLHINAEHYFLPVQGSTFHARDIFAPCAAWLSKGVEVDKIGDEITDYAKFSVPVSKLESGNMLTGEVLYVDKFGNSITNISYEDIKKVVEGSGYSNFNISVKEHTFNNVSPYYASINRGEPGVVVNGNGFLEIYVNQGDARRVLGLKRGEKVKLVFG